MATSIKTDYYLETKDEKVTADRITNLSAFKALTNHVTFTSVGTPSQGSITMLPPPKIVRNVGTLSPCTNAMLTFNITVTLSSLGIIYLNHKEDVIASGIDILSGNTTSIQPGTPIQ